MLCAKFRDDQLKCKLITNFFIRLQVVKFIERDRNEIKAASTCACTFTFGSGRITPETV